MPYYLIPFLLKYLFVCSFMLEMHFYLLLRKYWSVISQNSQYTSMLKIAGKGCLLITIIIFNSGVITKLRCNFLISHIIIRLFSFKNNSTRYFHSFTDRLLDVTTIVFFHKITVIFNGIIYLPCLKKRIK